MKTLFSHLRFQIMQEIKSGNLILCVNYASLCCFTRLPHPAEKIRRPTFSTFLSLSSSWLNIDTFFNASIVRGAIIKIFLALVSETLEVGSYKFDSISEVISFLLLEAYVRFTWISVGIVHFMEILGGIEAEFQAAIGCKFCHFRELNNWKWWLEYWWELMVEFQ